MMPSFTTQFIRQHPHTRARATKVTTPHGEFLTPTFMPVATKSFANYLTPDDLIRSGNQIILGGNTYHTLCQPGLQIVEKLGGMHNMMNWKGAMLTDSGGYQVFSLSKNSKICRIREDGAHFKHPFSGQPFHLTPKISIEAQKIIGADIIMPFDECTPEKGGRDAALAALDRTHRWLIESKITHEKHPFSIYGYPQALFGIVQGGSFRDLREASTAFVLAMDMDGIAFGGEAIGYDMTKTVEIISWLYPMLPVTKTRYTMGVGLCPQDIIDVVAEGIDIFDCVAPTRNARHGRLYHGKLEKEGNWFKFISEEPRNNIQIKKKQYAADERPILEDCDCYTCLHYSRGYLHYLFKQNTLAYSHLACIHNIHVMQRVCKELQAEILQDETINQPSTQQQPSHQSSSQRTTHRQV